jgi:hypothetical protein
MSTYSNNITLEVFSQERYKSRCDLPHIDYASLENALQLDRYDNETNAPSLYHSDPTLRETLSVIKNNTDELSVRLLQTVRYKTVYLASPIVLFNTVAYSCCYFALLQSEAKRILSPRTLYNSNSDWLTNFKRRDAALVDVAIFLCNPDTMIVGRGCYEEWLHFTSMNVPCYSYQNGNITSIDSMTIIDHGDWSNYAEMVVVCDG